jgi:hypothetical protein
VTLPNFVRKVKNFKTNGIAVGIATDYGLAGIDVSVQLRIFNLHIVQTDCGAHPPTYRMSIGGSFPGSKAVGVGGGPNYSLSTSVEVKKTWIYKSTPQFVFLE